MHRTSDYVVPSAIDPTQMSSMEKVVLAKLLSANSAINFFSTKANYRLKSSIKKTPINITRDILCRPCNPDGKHAGQIRYEVMDKNKLGKGSYGEVYQSLATLGVAESGLLLFKSSIAGKQRVIKKFIVDDDEMLEDTIRLAEYEYDLMRRMNHLHVKPPVYSREGVYLVMRKMPGSNLYDYLKRENKGELTLTVVQRLQLAIAIATALQTQVHDYNIMHRDLSSKNIMVYHTGENFIINIVDFDLASDINNVRPVGPFKVVHHSVAPELRDDYAVSSIQSDIYSLARAISEIFHFNVDSFVRSIGNYKRQLEHEEQHGIYLNGMCNGIKDLDESTKQQIFLLLKRMGRYQPEERCSLNEAIKELTRMYKDLIQPEDNSLGCWSWLSMLR